MLLLNTQFNVDNTLTRQVLFDIARKWLETSNFYSLELDENLVDWDGEPNEYHVECNDGREKAFIANYQNAFVMQFATHEDNDASVFTTTYVLDDTCDPYIMHFSQDRSFTGMSANSNSRRVNIPVILKNIFWNEYGAMDGVLPTEDKPYILRKNDISIAADIIQGKIAFQNPVVYVSPDKHSGSYSVNCNVLAQNLMGQAHVVVEGSPIIANLIRDKVDGANAFNGGVKVYIPGGQVLDFYPKPDSGINFDIINAVRNMQTRIQINDKYDVSKLKQTYMMSKLGSDSEIYKICESMLADKDSIIQQLQSELDKAKTDLSNAKCKAQNLQESFDKTRAELDKSVEFELTEDDLYDDEIKTVILKVLQKEFDNIKDDANAQRSRKYDVLKDILDHNFPCDTDTRLIECIRSAFKDGNLTKEGIGCLQASGFKVSKGKEHYHITLHNDDRYMAVFAVTPSDNRASKNGTAEFAKLLFGY